MLLTVRGIGWYLMCAEHTPTQEWVVEEEFQQLRGLGLGPLWRGYDYEPWSNGHSFLLPSSPPRPPTKGHGRVNWLSPNVRMVWVLQVPLSLHVWSWRGSSGRQAGHAANG